MATITNTPFYDPSLITKDSLIKFLDFPYIPLMVSHVKEVLTFWVKADWQSKWQRVTRREYVRVERHAGFFPPENIDPDTKEGRNMFLNREFDRNGIQGKVIRKVVRPKNPKWKAQHGYRSDRLFGDLPHPSDKDKADSAMALAYNMQDAVMSARLQHSAMKKATLLADIDQALMDKITKTYSFSITKNRTSTPTAVVPYVDKAMQDVIEKDRKMIQAVKP